MRAVSVLEVSDAGVWQELEALIPLDDHLGEALSPLRRVTTPSFEREALPALQRGGAVVLVRNARRSVETQRGARAHLADEIAGLSLAARSLLFAAQRYATDHLVLGAQVWDPGGDAPSVRELLSAQLIEPLADDEAPDWAGRYHLHPDLPPPPPLAWDLEEAVMEETDDLQEGPGSPVALLHDLAALAAAIGHLSPRRTHANTLSKADARRLGQRLADEELACDGQLEPHPRWGRALLSLELLGAVCMDPVSRRLSLDLGLEGVLAGSTSLALDRLVHRLVDPDLRVALPAVHAALVQAGPGAVDEVVFLDLVREQHRDLLFRPWLRRGAALYPTLGDNVLRMFDDAGFDAVEAPMIQALLRRLHLLGLIRRAPGVFAASPDGRVWAGIEAGPMPPIWISSDLEVVVPPG
ncbi:MAG TPA: hypothetical protein ENK18_03185, partial [Deltaproteobacteria bacterium]|nr:hypothetical protein [Deltaproteobacteria bacterium]